MPALADPAAFRAALGAVCTPVAVVTSAADGRPHGTTVSAFCSVSLEPPLVLVSLDRGSELLRVVRAAGAYGVNVLEADQGALARGFARKGEGRFDGVAWHEEDGLPRLDGAGAWLSCVVRDLVEAGDHVLAVAAVRAADHDAREPLLYQRSSFGRLARAA